MKITALRGDAPFSVRNKSIFIFLCTHRPRYGSNTSGLFRASDAREAHHHPKLRLASPDLGAGPGMLTALPTS